MAALSWIRACRNVTGIVRQRELVHFEALMDAEAGRQPAYNLFILSCAIPACIATFGGLSVFGAWISGANSNSLILGTAFTLLLAAGAWITFFRLYRASSRSRRHLRDLIAKITKRYASFGNIFLGERQLSEQFENILDEASCIYMRHADVAMAPRSMASDTTVRAIEESLSRLFEAALGSHPSQVQAVSWAEPLLNELRLLDQSIQKNSAARMGSGFSDPMESLRAARADIEVSTQAIQEIENRSS